MLGYNETGRGEGADLVLGGSARAYRSGFGRDKSMHALEKYADLETVWIGLRR